MRRGELRHHVEIQQEIPAGTNDYGEPANAARTGPPEWTTIAWRFANIISMEDREFMQGGQVRAAANFRIIMRYYPLSSKHRIKWGSRIFHVVPADNPGERGKSTEMGVNAVEEVA